MRSHKCRWSFTVLESLMAVTLCVVALTIAFRMAVPLMQHPSNAADAAHLSVQAQQTWELIASEVRWAGWRVEGRSLWTEPRPEGGNNDALWVRYIDDTYRERPRLVEGFFTAGTDGLGHPNLMWSSASGWRQPIARGVVRFQVLRARDITGREASASAPSMQGVPWVAVQVRIQFEDGSEGTRWLATQFRSMVQPDGAT